MTDYRIWPATDGPAIASIDGAAVSLATEFYITSAGWLTHLWFWRPTTQVTGTITGRVYEVAGGTAVPGTDVTFTVSGTGWISAALATPVALSTNTRYRATVHFPSNYASTTSYWSTGPGGSGITNGILTAPGSGGGPTQSSFQGAFNYGAAISFPNSQFSASNYWVDLTVTDVDPNATIVIEHGLPVETDGPLPMSLVKAVTHGQPVTADTAFPLTVVKQVDLGLPAEVSAALPVELVKAVGLGLPVETNSALPLGLVKPMLHGLPATVDTALALTLVKAVVMGLPVETDSALGMRFNDVWPPATEPPVSRRWASTGPPIGHRWASSGPPAEVAG